VLVEDEGAVAVEEEGFRHGNRVNLKNIERCEDDQCPRT
jgi:hypothetical protein